MFTQEQLDFIKKCAKERKNQGEIAVYDLVKNLSLDGFIWEGFTEQQLNIIKYCAEECKRQRSGEMSVYDMVNAWNYADKMIGHIDLDFIAEIGRIVEPDDNRKGFRTIPIGVTDGYGGWIEKAPHHRIEFLLSTLISSYYDGLLEKNLDHVDYNTSWARLAETAEDQFYYEYENIHPFRDGNGRSGKILYNYLNGTLDNPIMPPNFWGSSNP